MLEKTSAAVSDIMRDDTIRPVVSVLVWIALLLGIVLGGVGVGTGVGITLIRKSKTSVAPVLSQLPAPSLHGQPPESKVSEPASLPAARQVVWVNEETWVKEVLSANEPVLILFAHEDHASTQSMAVVASYNWAAAEWSHMVKFVAVDCRERCSTSIWANYTNFGSASGHLMLRQPGVEPVLKEVKCPTLPEDISLFITENLKNR